MKYKIGSFMLIFMLVIQQGVFAKVKPAAKEKVMRIDARAAVAIDGKSGAVLYEKNAHSIVPMASTTKIITSLVAINRGKLDEKVVISKSAANIKGSTVGYRAGEQISLRELLYGLMYRSGNDAAIAIAEHIGGTLDNFYIYMNECSRNIGLVNSSFNSPHGLDTQNHYSTAYDLALATRKAMENEVFREIVGTKEIKKDKFNFTRDYVNINKILSIIPEANGVKTGYTGGAGKCLVSSVRYEDRDIIIVVLNCPNRWNETNEIYQYVKANYSECKDLFKVSIPNEKLITSGLLKLNEVSMEVPKDGIDSEIYFIKPKKNILKGDYIGFVRIKSKKDGKEIYRKNLYSNRNFKKESFNDLIS
ncbi:D-alanyl-D-alanine carboxypeptidase family protein [Clostridium sp. 'White wine YQ']|uniref:D-alanyl-D-alanine carboxypeptidase family protein n=1 Tax=Clostridium sp. 'White wine YQ' TaxID=3027474 RepID=UPI0023653435|nr:D-alanyl-D-alanine carboxypeptidase family protein [Clostridium sp. 'White wine YQ']MDD7793877.1 D-alanyl-D-alanine carboxypeptidase [Clostridium sp. 'White wine YQ']